MERRIEARVGTAPYWVACILLGMVVVALVAHFYPGNPSNDVLVQYQQAVSGHFSDRHPPMGALMLAALMWTGNAIGTMFVAQNLLYVAGVIILSFAIVTSGRIVAGCVVLAAALSPLVLFYNTQIYADVTLYVLLLLAIGGTALFRLPGRMPGIVAYVVLTVILLVAMLVRANAVFAVGPLFLYLFAPQILRRPVWAVLLSLAIAGAGIALTTVFDRGVVAAERSGFDDALPFYDIMGITAYSGDTAHLPPSWHLSLAEARKCYSPHYWDPFTREFCGEAFQRIALSPAVAPVSVKRVWIGAILKHPVAYAEHRLKHFDAQLNWIEPSLQCRFAPLDDKCGDHDARTGRAIPNATLSQLIRQDYLKKNFLTWPVGSLALSLVVLALSGSVADEKLRILIRAGILSAVIYAIMYLFVGIAANIRYFLWTTLASGIFGGLLVTELVRQRYPLLRLIGLLAGTLAAIWFVGLVARLGDWSWFIT